MDVLLIIRGLAAISVVIWHAGGYQAGLPLINVPGRTAVWIFFGISGYVIAYGFLYKRYALTVQGLRHFYVNRFLRIYPLFLLLSILGWLTIWTADGRSPISWIDIPRQFLALQFNHDYRLNSVFWTLGLEIQFYMMAPALALPLLIKNPAQRWTVAATVYFGLVVFIGFSIKQLGWSVDGRNIVTVLPHFLAGMVGCSLAMSIKPDLLKAVAYMAGGVLLLAVTNWFYHRHPVLYWSLGVPMTDLMILSFIFSHASLKGISADGSYLIRGLAWMGTLSYGIYAWHAFLMSSVDDLSGRWSALLAASIGLAYLSYRVVESPALKLKRWQPSRSFPEHETAGLLGASGSRISGDLMNANSSLIHDVETTPRTPSDKTSN
jgi:peptidoglycan/LPS O-acetylase OafA/YrhL